MGEQKYLFFKKWNEKIISPLKINENQSGLSTLRKQKTKKNRYFKLLYSMTMCNAKNIFLYLLQKINRGKLIEKRPIKSHHNSILQLNPVKSIKLFPSFITDIYSPFVRLYEICIWIKLNCATFVRIYKVDLSEFLSCVYKYNLSK